MFIIILNGIYYSQDKIQLESIVHFFALMRLIM